MSPCRQWGNPRPGVSRECPTKLSEGPPHAPLELLPWSPTCLAYSFLALPWPSPPSFWWHPAPSFKWKSDFLLLKISPRVITLQRGIAKAKGLYQHLHGASRLSLCPPLHTSTCYTLTLLDAPSFGSSRGQNFFSFMPCGFHLERLSLEPLHGVLLTHAQQVSAPGKPPGALPAPKPNRPPHPHRDFSVFVYPALYLFPHLELSN